MYLTTYTKSVFSLLSVIALAGCGGNQFEDTAVNQAIRLDTVNDALEVTSEKEISIFENNTAVITVTASGGAAPISYSISLGDDADLFAIDTASGALTFIETADYERPADKDKDNIYNVSVAAISDTGETAIRALSVTILDVDETPVVEEVPITEEIVPAEGPAATEVLVSVEEPVVVEVPAIVEEPAATEVPVSVEEPAAAEKPVVVEAPAIVEEPAAVEETPLCAEGPAKIEGHVTDIAGGSGIANVQVSVGGCVTTTNENGDFTLKNIAETERAVVNFEKEGYFRGSALIQVDHYAENSSKISPNYLEYAIDTYDYQWSYDSQTVVSGANIAIPAAVYADTAGNAYHGAVTAGLKILDVTTDEGKTLFPGAFEGKNANGEMVLFGSYGLITVALKDANGKALSLSDGATATLTFDAVASLEEQNIIPLWYYDYDQGLWIEEGYAELQSDGTYQGRVSHLGTWSLNLPVETAPGTYRGRIVYVDGITVKDARVIVTGPNWIGTDLSTDADGLFEIEVVPGDDFRLEAYNYKWKYEAKYNGILPAIASGEIVEDRM